MAVNRWWILGCLAHRENYTKCTFLLPGAGVGRGAYVAPSACYSESLGWRSWSNVPTEKKIPQIASFTCSLFWFFPRRWPHTERIIFLIHRRTLPSGWRITFWRLSWLYFQLCLWLFLRCLFFICKMEQLISTCVTVVLQKSVTKCLQYTFSFFWRNRKCYYYVGKVKLSIDCKFS